MEKAINIFNKLLSKERNIYQEAELFNQNRKSPDKYVDILIDTDGNKNKLKIIGDNLISENGNSYKIIDNAPNFTKTNYDDYWEQKNAELLNYHKSLSAYTLLNSSPINNYISLHSEIGKIQNKTIVDVGGGTGHMFASFFQYPETLDYYLIDPNLRLLHDQLLRVYPKLSYLEISHIIAYAEQLPIKDNFADVLMSYSAIDHLADYKKFISEAYRVTKKDGIFFVSSHLAMPAPKSYSNKNNNFLERLTRYLYYRKFNVGSDDHTLHLKDTKILEESITNAGFRIEKVHTFDRFFYIIARKPNL